MSKHRILKFVAAIKGAVLAAKGFTWAQKNILQHAMRIFKLELKLVKNYLLKLLIVAILLLIVGLSLWLSAVVLLGKYLYDLYPSWPIVGLELIIVQALVTFFLVGLLYRYWRSVGFSHTLTALKTIRIKHTVNNNVGLS